MARHQTLLQDTNKSFQDVHLWPKNYWILPDSLWNSTTVVILINSLAMHLRLNSLFSLVLLKNRGYTLIWPRLWNFIGSQAKFNSFLVTNEHPERICLYLVREFDYEPSKIGHFQISKSIFGANCDLIFLKQKFLFEYQIRRTTFIKSIYFFDQSEKTLFSKNEPYFWRLVIKLSYKIQTNPFRMFICDHKTIEFHLTHHEMPRPWSC